MIAGNLLQQIYNLVDALIVGKCLGADALASVGSSYTLMIFILDHHRTLHGKRSVFFC